MYLRKLIKSRIKYFQLNLQVQTEFQQISDRQCVTTIADADNINHIVVFLTGNIPFPEGTAGQGNIFIFIFFFFFI